MEMPTFTDKDFCTGCTACASVCSMNCIEMKEDECGFSFPFITDLSRCISCGKCEKVCPIQEHDKIMGDRQLAFAAYSNNLDMRMESSSGGIFSEIAAEIFDLEGVVFGAAYDDEFCIHHVCAERKETLYKLRGAKYAESKLGNTFPLVKKKLEDGKWVLFTGTPCQVGGLKSFLGHEDEHLICVDFICHGVPSPMVWKEYIKYRAQIDAEGELPLVINLREKKSGWSRYQYSNYFGYSEGKTYREVSTESRYMKLFTDDYISRQACENCVFKGYKRCSDITLGDFWGIWDVAPEMDDNRGTSAVLIHSEKGLRIWNQIKEHLQFKSVKPEQIAEQNPSLLVASKLKSERTEVLDIICRGGFEQALEIEKKNETLLKRVKKILRGLVKQR